MKKQILTSDQFRTILNKDNKNKYGAKKKEYNGRLYHSTGEANYAAQLDLLKKAGEITAIEPQFPIKIIVNGVFICHYLIDFKIELKNGQIEYHEFKGYSTESFRLKFKLVKALYPEWNFKLIKK